MHSPSCWEELTIKILLWVCAFGVIEKGITCLEHKIDQVLAYLGILIIVIIYIVASSHNAQWCALM